MIKFFELKIPAILTAAAITLFTAAAATTFAVGASPLRVEYHAMPGETVKGQLNVRNTSDEAHQIIINKADFDVDPETEDVLFFDGSETGYDRSLKKWIKFPEEPVIVEGKEKAVIPYEIAVPEEAAKQGYYGALFVESMPVDQNQNGQQPGALGLNITTRVAHLILLEVGEHSEDEIELQDINVSKDGENLTMEILTFNKGLVHNSPEGEIEIFNNRDETIDVLPLNKGNHNIMPLRKKTYLQNCPLNEFKPGSYTAVLKGKTERGSELIGEIEFELTDENEIIIHGKKLNEVDGITMRAAAEKSKSTVNTTAAVSVIIIAAVLFTLIAKYAVCNARLIKCGTKRGPGRPKKTAFKKFTDKIKKIFSAKK